MWLRDYKEKTGALKVAAVAQKTIVAKQAPSSTEVRQ
jgi:hypothetical protein